MVTCIYSYNYVTLLVGVLFMGSPVKIKLPINKVLGPRKANKTPSGQPRTKGVEESIN